MYPTPILVSKKSLNDTYNLLSIEGLCLHRVILIYDYPLRSCIAGVKQFVIVFFSLSEGVGEKYVATASYCGEYQEDISFPEGAMVEILEKSASGWWMIR